MNIFQFIAEYCQDLVKDIKKEKEMIDLSTFAHDAIITDSEGNKVPVVIVDTLEIPVSDFLSLDKQDFLAQWKSLNAAEAYDNYISALEILEGAEALTRVRHAILSERARLSEDVDLVTMI